MTIKKTPMYESHVALGGRMVEFAGFLMPVSFEGIVAEHERVRTQVGLFDVSHMGEIEITGSGATAFGDYIVTNNVARLAPGQICYTVACNERGTVLDDLLVYKFSQDRILLVVNAVNTDKIAGHLGRLDSGGSAITNRTSDIGQIAVQGPRSLELLLACDFCAPVRDELPHVGYYRFLAFEHSGDEVILSRTGYTGERGYEIYVPAARALEVWSELLAAGAEFGVGPIGLGARDTLRFEASYCLYGHELDEETSPLEAGLSWVVKFMKGDYIGREALEAEKERGPARRLAGFEIVGRGIARQGMVVQYGGDFAGTVTSGTFAPSLRRSLAMALVSDNVPQKGEGFAIDIRGKQVPARSAALPFYRNRSAD
jgi:aminomethyltransferase